MERWQRSEVRGDRTRDCFWAVMRIVPCEVPGGRESR
jgi:hypothetical protein